MQTNIWIQTSKVLLCYVLVGSAKKITTNTKAGPGGGLVDIK
jgi:hypothetical protein